MDNRYILHIIHAHTHTTKVTDEKSKVYTAPFMHINWYVIDT